MSAANNYSVLIQVQSQNEAERIIGIFRSAGIHIRAHRVTSEIDLNEHLQESDWDLLILDNNHPEVSLSFSMAALKSHKTNTAIMLITEDASGATHKQAFSLGIHDVVLKNADEHFVHACVREMQASQLRINHHNLQEKFNTLEQRADKLLAESDDAIAYVADGILMSSNEKFAEIFAYDADDLDCASIIDLVDSQDHERFKNFLKAFSKGELEQGSLTFQALKQSGEVFEAFLALENATVDDEPCIQVIIGSESRNSGNGSGDMDTATGLYNRYYLAQQMNNVAAQVCAGSMQASLLIYHVDDYERLLADLHISGMDALIRDLASHLEAHISTGDIVARLDSDTVALISQQPPESALQTAEKSLKTMDEHIFEFNGRTLQYTCTCAVLNLNDKDTDVLLDQTVDAINTVRLNNRKNSAEIYTPKVAKNSGKSESASNLDDALQSEQLRLLFQPIMSLRGDDKENYEARVSQFDGENDSYPQAIIDADKACKLDRWIILEASKALSLHRAEGHNTRLIINLTVNALTDKTLAPWLSVAIKAANLPNDSIVFQFDETDIRNNLKSAISCFEAFKGNNCKVAIDNFAEDSEPLKLLKHLKVDIIRIAPQFTTAVAEGNDKGELKQLLTDLAAFDVQTILPDVENAGVLASLWQLGTHYIQGSYLQLPSPQMSYVFTELA
ncbi:MAG: EAL domain-containing protein [Pseudomonadales bacterium]|nr:EAL domain-containing protein [Pseudomonadales bacterium]